ncbi:MAG: diaminopimelate epimerase [Hyphomicrobiales bacterium]|nr:diaminopimelate epimerase [Hyphomicrobiales bacterium]MBV9519880.1 diaminopimelate epimerase [Hyphomicrobiales bacterium]
MSGLANRPFLKMNGLGNEIVVLDLRGSSHRVTPAEARAIAAGRSSHFDQLMVLHDPLRHGSDAFMRIYNTDGSEAEACGNGTRCVAWTMLRDNARRSLRLETKVGLVECERKDDETFTVDMGTPRFAWREIPLAEEFVDTRRIELQIGPIDAPILHTPSAVNMGNPHAIFWVEDLEAIDLARTGPLLENHPIFPQRANISIARVMDRHHVRLRVWERGAGLTRACGSAACAAAVAGHRLELLERNTVVTLPGGDLCIEWRDGDDHVLMTGPVELEHEGIFAQSLFAATAEAPAMP